MSENRPFVARMISRIQRQSIEDGHFVAACTMFLMRLGRLAWDEDRALFWVNHPSEGWQVAVWMMPVALNFEPAA